MKKKTECPFGATSNIFSYRSNSKVEAILFKNNLEFKVQNSIWDTVGNFLILAVQTENKDFLLVSLYGLNTDQPKFYSNFKNEIKKTYSNHIIMARYFNIVMNKNLDTINYKKT